MKVLNKKIIRDIKKNLSQFITIFLMVMIGVMVYSGIESYMDGMTETANTFYTSNNLQDLNVAGAKFTEKDLENIKKIDNVKDAERKLSITGTTDNDKTLLLNFIESNNISRFYIIEGEKFNKAKSGVWLDNFYAIENNIKVGDTILVKYESMELNEKVLGLINVPDHLYDVQDEAELYPNRKEFGFAYLSANEITENYIKSKVMKEMNIEKEEVFNVYVPDFNYKDYIVFNYIMVDVDDTAKINDVKMNIENKIENAKAIINIEDSLSYVTYQGEIDEGKTYVGVFSGLFIFIAMLSVVTTMTRVVKNQRTQIGTLKALGFNNRKIILHYISYGFWVSALASVVGLVLGRFFIGSVFMDLQMAFFEIPNGHPIFNIQCYISAILVVLTVSFITYITGGRILKENPAETLRNKIPNIRTESINITTSGLFKKLGFSSKWNLRDIIRNKMRTIMGIAGVAGCAMLIVCAIGMLDSMNFFIKLQFDTIYNFDYKLNIKEDISATDLDSLYDEYGEMTSESLAIEIKNSDSIREANNIFVTDAEDYVRFIDRKNMIIDKPNDDGIYVTYKLAETKGYGIGDEVTWHIYGDANYRTSKIIGFNKDPQNQNISMTRNYLESLGIEYKPDSLYSNKDLSNIKEITGIDTIQNIESLKEGMAGMLSMMKTMLILLIGVAIVLGGIIIYNLSILSYSEKQYQFATLKVLGFKDKKIKGIFVKQNNWITIISIVVGLPLGFYLTDWLFKTAIEEHYDFNANILTQTYVIAAVGTFVVSYLTNKILARKIEKIDMVSSLKGDE